MLMIYNYTLDYFNNYIDDIHICIYRYTCLTNNSLSLKCLKIESLYIKTSTTIFLSPQITINNLSILYANKVKNSVY